MNLNFNQLINEIRKLNPGVEIRICDPSEDPLSNYKYSSRIFSSIPVEYLKLPEGFYEKNNSITNKANSTTGIFFDLTVYPLEDIIPGTAYPNVDVSKPLETIDIRELAIAIQRINPGVSIRLSNPELDEDADHKIWSEVSVDELALPEPYYVNPNYGISHRYIPEISYSVEDIKKAQNGTLIKTGYDLDEEKRKQQEIDMLRDEKYGMQNFAYSEQEPTPEEELVKIAREHRKFTILKREREMDEAERNRNRSAILAGLCILGTGAAIYFNGQDPRIVLQHELDAIYSWEALAQYIQDLGPLTTLLTTGAVGFIARYLRNSRRFREAQEDFIDMNASLEETQELGGNTNAKSR